MISVIAYGRNDSHGYNLHRRAALSLNCIAHVLTHPDDEILFVDCNTPDDMPTFPEAIQDTLTERTKQLLRTIRVRPAVYAKHKGASPLQVLEALCRNVALRRSNPANRWVLSTNTDLVFIPRVAGQSLSDVVHELPDGFYELPRFEVPETLWETIDRADPAAAIAAFQRWGRTLHLNCAIIAEPHIRFDGPGDFQLILRRQLCDIHGFDEAMIFGANVDANICRRLYLLNGSTDSLLDRVFAYHCDHTRQSTHLHRAGRRENDRRRFDHAVTTPHLPHQAQTWGLAEEALEEIRLTKEYSGRFAEVIEDLLPALTSPLTEDVLLAEQSFDHGLLYDSLHVFPFLADHITTLSPLADIGYVGGNRELLHLLGEYRRRCGHGGRIFVEQEVYTRANPSGMPSLPYRSALVELQQVVAQADILIFDAAMMSFPTTKNAFGIPVPAPTEQAEQYKGRLLGAFLVAAAQEKQRIQSGAHLPRKFIFVSSMHTWFEHFVARMVGLVLAPYSTHVRHGYLLQDSPLLADPQQVLQLARDLRVKSAAARPPVACDRSANRPATIGIDARTLFEDDSISRGIGHYTRFHLLHTAKLKHEWTFLLYCNPGRQPEEVKALLELPNVEYRLIADYRPEQVDILHLPDAMNAAAQFVSPFKLFSAKYVTVTFYDLIPFLFYWRQWSAAAREEYLGRLSDMRRVAHTVFTISNRTRQDLITHFQFPAERLTAVMAGLNNHREGPALNDAQTQALLARLRVTQPFFLHVGALDPHKNFEAVVKCHLRCNQKRSVQLVVVGRMSYCTKAFADQIAQYGIKGIRFTGYLPRNELEALYRRATALVWLTNYEGFGLPVLEAMANGCPVIASNAASIPEVAGDAAWLFAPTDIEKISAAMLLLLSNPEHAARLKRQGCQRAALFSWEKTAHKTIDVWQTILAGDPSRRVGSRNAANAGSAVPLHS